MKLNPKLLEVSSKTGIRYPKVLKIAFAYAVYRECVELLAEYDISGEVDPDEEHKVRIHLADLKEGNYVLKFPLFIDEENDQRFDEFMKLLRKQQVGVNGHVNNLKKYAVLDKSQETKEAFRAYIPANEDLQLASKVFANFYRIMDFPKHISKAFSMYEDLKGSYELETDLDDLYKMK